jgi:hypothetical protein
LKSVPLWILFWHDWDKFLPDEFIPYAAYFYGNTARRGADGVYVRQAGESEAFDFAWLLHQKRNKHHWQWWMLPKDDGSTQIFPMSDLYRREMMADWRGAGRAHVKGWTPQSTVDWYELNKHKMQLHPMTRLWVEAELQSYADFAAKEKAHEVAHLS